MAKKSGVSFADRGHSSNVGDDEANGLIPDEHDYREKMIRHRRLELMARRLDARISSIETLATQARAICASVRPSALLSRTKHALSLARVCAVKRNTALGQIPAQQLLCHRTS
eukprot:279132-Pleurochrysis_carterae.AAC.2